MATMQDFERLDLFRFLNKPEHGPKKIFRVHAIGGGWISCRIPSANNDAEHRFSFSEDYLRDAEIDKVGKGFDMEREPVYTKPRPTKKLKLGGTWTPRKRGRPAKKATE